MITVGAHLKAHNGEEYLELSYNQLLDNLKNLN